VLQIDENGSAQLPASRAKLSSRRAGPAARPDLEAGPVVLAIRIVALGSIRDSGGGSSASRGQSDSM
jgi:hypothetical protein